MGIRPRQDLPFHPASGINHFSSIHTATNSWSPRLWTSTHFCELWKYSCITSWTSRSWNEPLNSSDCKPQAYHPSHQTGSLASSDLLSFHHHIVLPCCQVSTVDPTSFLSSSGSHNKSLDVALGASINLPHSLVPCLPTNSPLDSIYSITNSLTLGLLAHLDMTKSCQLALLQTSDL